MADNHSKEVRSMNMSHIRSTNSKPEEIVRKYLFAEGFRYRKNVRTLPGCPDIVLPKHKTVIFVNGCFWHKHDCPRFVWPSSNTDYWYPKILRNIERDQSNTNKLQELGWQVIVVWECELKKPLLQRYRKTKGEIEEKRRCWHVEYEDVPQFHMDVIPAVFRSEYIDITDHDEEKDSYEYIGSNPRGYVEWFRERMAKRRQALREQYCSAHRDVIKSQADVEALKEYHFKTPLQKAIQILKRHRDIMFETHFHHYYYSRRATVQQLR